MKKKLSKLFLFACCATLPLSCAPKETKPESNLFNFDSLISGQVKLLVENRAVLQKEVQMQDKKEHVTMEALDSQRWMNELEIFQQLSQINKPINSASYVVTESSDSQSNLKVRSFHSNDKVAFQDIKIYYLETPSHIRKIESIVNQQNPIYKSAKMLTLNFNEVYSKLMLTSYSIEGGQHMVLGDTVQFKILGAITVR